MNAIKVSKSELLKTLRENLEAHQAAYAEARDGYKDALIAEIEAALAKVKAGDLKYTYSTLTVPVDHSKDYQRAISMLEYSVEDTVLLEERDFQQFVQDEWAWKEAFAASNLQYSKSR